MKWLRNLTVPTEKFELWEKEVPPKMVLMMRVPPSKARRISRRVPLAKWSCLRPVAYRNLDAYP